MPEMHRRTFLRSLGLAAAGMALDPELALWVPGRTTYFDIQTPRKLQEFVVTAEIGHTSFITPRWVTLDTAKAWTDTMSKVFEVGDTFTIDGVYA